MTIRVAGRGYAQAPVKSLYDLTLPAAGRFDVTGIPPGYSWMEIFLWGRSTVAATNDETYFFLNGDTTQTNYRRRTNNLDSSYSSSVGDNAFALEVTAANSPADYFSAGHMVIQNYAGSDIKIVTYTGGIRIDATIIRRVAGTIHWESSAAINQVTWQPDGYATDNFVAGSRLQIWLHR